MLRSSKDKTEFKLRGLFIITVIFNFMNIYNLCASRIEIIKPYKSNF